MSGYVCKGCGGSDFRLRASVLDNGAWIWCSACGNSTATFRRKA